MPFISVSSESEAKKITSSNDKGLIMYGASWCDGCIRAKPLMKKKSAKVSFPIVFVDVDKCKVITDEVPAFAFFEGGRRTDYIVGDVDKVLNKCDELDSGVKSNENYHETKVEISEYTPVKDTKHRKEKKEKEKSKDRKHSKKDKKEKEKSKDRKHSDKKSKHDKKR